MHVPHSPSSARMLSSLVYIPIALADTTVNGSSHYVRVKQAHVKHLV